ncbi:hypothetical protein S40285_10775, partial [Stachybotrys chlorohalonatus IBT 40285]
MVMWVQQQYA